MAKLSLKADPTFSAKVAIPRAGRDPVEVEFTFKHRTRPEFVEWIGILKGRDTVDAVMECAVGWELEDSFTKESIIELDVNYMGAGDAIIDKYLSELTNARLGN